MNLKMPEAWTNGNFLRACANYLVDNGLANKLLLGTRDRREQTTFLETNYESKFRKNWSDFQKIIQKNVSARFVRFLNMSWPLQRMGQPTSKPLLHSDEQLTSTGAWWFWKLAHSSAPHRTANMTRTTKVKTTDEIQFDSPI